MKLVLTRSSDGVKFAVESDAIKLIEPAKADEGTHIVLGADLVRTVKESVDQILASIGSVAV